MEPRPLKLIIEALLFSSDRPLSAKEIQGWMGQVNVSEVRSALEELRADYEQMGRSFLLQEVAGGFQFRTKSEYSPFILKMLKTTPSKLSRAALETLAIVAYKQPIVRQEIEQLRGVDVGGILRSLLEKDLIRIVGRKNLPGKPLVYGTTKRFLEVFGLKDLDSLPRLKEIRELTSKGTEGNPSSTPEPHTTSKEDHERQKREAQGQKI